MTPAAAIVWLSTHSRILWTAQQNEKGEKKKERKIKREIGKQFHWWTFSFSCKNHPNNHQVYCAVGLCGTLLQHYLFITFTCTQNVISILSTTSCLTFPPSVVLSLLLVQVGRLVVCDTKCTFDVLWVGLFGVK